VDAFASFVTCLWALAFACDFALGPLPWFWLGAAFTPVLMLDFLGLVLLPLALAVVGTKMAID